MGESLGKGEVESSILSCSTIFPNEINDNAAAPGDGVSADLRMNDSRTAARNRQVAKRIANEPACLYRHYDHQGNLLYVGISVSVAARLARHSSGSPWYHLIEIITVEHFDTRAEALAAEKVAIAKERPIHNKTHATKKPKTASGPKEWPMEFDDKYEALRRVARFRARYEDDA